MVRGDPVKTGQPGMRKPRIDPVRYKLAVTATAVRVNRTGPGISNMAPEGESGSVITLEGTLDRPVLQERRAAVLIVFERHEPVGNPGAAIGGSSTWRVVCHLPRPSFADLLALVLAGRLTQVDMLFEKIRHGKGILRSVDFETPPVCSDQEHE